ncbi:hypothetical protein JOB18_040345 [Solea senegalensis]|uniref:Uncharacterized protein n=1 Tax=Solea senegalensis TaxID=28829 RepID=A0AAV6PAE3_SOLSE|nr:hypothetical protein JOB18_040345 [Solea senegalensis]
MVTNAISPPEHTTTHVHIIEAKNPVEQQTTSEWDEFYDDTTLFNSITNNARISFFPYKTLIVPEPKAVNFVF